jgi:hypothetical protein
MRTETPNWRTSFVRKFARLWVLGLFLATLASCGTTLFVRRTVYVHPGQVVRLREPVHAKVWVKVDGRWEPSYMEIPEGWYAGYVEPEED